MKKLLIILVLFSCSEQETEVVKPKPELKEECKRLLANDYDLYPDDECRCVYLRRGEPGVQDSYTFSHKWTPLEYRMYLDSLICGHDVIDYGTFDIIKSTIINNDATLECDC